MPKENPVKEVSVDAMIKSQDQSAVEDMCRLYGLYLHPQAMGDYIKT